MSEKKHEHGNSSESGEPEPADTGPEERRRQFLRERGLPEDEDFYHPASTEPDVARGEPGTEPTAPDAEEPGTSAGHRRT